MGNSLEENLLGKGDIQAGMNYRYFKSFRHFRGTEALTAGPRNWDTAFADYVINFGITYRIPGNKVVLDPSPLEEFKQ